MSDTNTGIEMEEDDEGVLNNDTDAIIETTHTEIVGDRQLSEVDIPNQVPANAGDEKLDSISLSTSLAVEAENSLAQNTGEILESGNESTNKTSTYTQEYVDQLIAKLRDSERQLQETKLKLEKAENRIQSINDENNEREKKKQELYSILGDASPGMISKIIDKAADALVRVDKSEKLQQRYDNLQLDKENAERKNREKNQECCELQERLEETRKNLESTVKEREQYSSDYQILSGQYEAINASRERLLHFPIPNCLVGKAWFTEFFNDLLLGLQENPIHDPAMLVFASLAELVVMERNSAAPCFEWKKQLTDIGLVVANYMHQKKSAEEDVLKVLRNFSQAFQEMPILKELKIISKVPSLGGDFNIEEVRHRNNGSSISKVLNWCIVEDGHVYCKAIVE